MMIDTKGCAMIVVGLAVLLFVAYAVITMVSSWL